MSGADETMVYVATDPNQPGAAWACTVDRAEYAKDTAKTLSDWVRRGAKVERVHIDTARTMLAKWVRPKKRGERGGA